MIAAEALVELADPLAALLGCGPARPVDRVRRSLALSAAPLEAACDAPTWLLSEQVAPYRRAVAALERHGGALLADPVGSGKTWIALAVARLLGEAVAVVPASLREQWRRTAAALDISLRIHSHEALSRGRLPQGQPRLVIVDESHRFRTPGTRRYRELACWVVGRRVLLLSATPVVNRLADLGHQLRLGVRDDALAARGVPSLSRMFATGGAAPPLGDVVLCRPRPADRPSVDAGVIAWTPAATDGRILAGVDRLRLSNRPAHRALIRMVLWRALASSRAALAHALRRYRALLDHARDAAAAGRPVGRREIRSFTRGEPDQLLLWELLPTLPSPADLALEDRPALEGILALLAESGPDPRATAVSSLLADRCPTLVFTGSRDTLCLLRRSLAPLRPAWVSGSGAGIGDFRLSREAVLDLFRPATDRHAVAESTAPTVLLATDVAAEGLDLQRAGRIVHFDLPWTSVRLDQREGRAVRLGSDRATVEVLRLAPWPALEERLRQDQRLLTKRRLAAQAGVDDAGQWLFRWRSELAGVVGEGPAGAGLAMVEGDTEGWLVGLALDLVLPDGQRWREPAGLFWVTANGAVDDRPETIVPLLAAMEHAPGRTPTVAERSRATEMLLGLARTRLAGARKSSWLAREAAPEQRRLVRRMRRLVLDAARRRNRPLLDLAERALAWLAGGVTAGEAILVADLLQVAPPRLERAWQPLLARPRLRPIPAPRLTGIIGVSKFPACPPSGPCSSISTAR